MSEGPFCGCTRITYDPVDLGNGSKAERWTCAVQGGCGREFVPKARAEQALATVTAERDEARARLRDVGEHLRELQAHALPTDCVRCGGVGAEPPGCPESGPCECCGGWTAHKRLVVAEPSVLRAKLAEVERERDEAMTLAEERRDYARAQNAKLSVACDDLRAQLTAVERERDEAHAALRDCATRLGNGSAVSPKASHAFHCAVATEVGIVVPALRAQLAKTEAVVDAAREDAQHCPHACSPPCPFDRAVARTRAALRALDAPYDSPVGVAATAEDGHEAPAQNRQPVGQPSDPATGTTRREPPETARDDGSTGAVALCGEWLPAANSTCALPRGHDGVHDPWAPGVKSPTLREIHATTRREVEALRQAMITRAELDELRWRVERLENLTGSGSGSGSG